MISFAFAKINKPNNNTIPVTCAYSINLSPGFLPVIISYIRNNTCPPSNAGIGRMFIIAKIIDRNAVRFQNACQSQVPGKILPIVINPPRDL
jgi:hypothetical protein